MKTAVAYALHRASVDGLRAPAACVGAPDAPPAPTRPPLRAIRTDWSREVGLSLILGLEIGIMFVMAPLAASGIVAPVVLDLLRLGLAATAVILLTRNWIASLSIGATFSASLVLSFAVRSQGGAEVVSLGRITAATGFDLAIAWAVADVAFGAGRVTVHRIMGAVILYLSIGLLFANAYRACAFLLHPSFSGLTRTGRFLSDSLYFSLTTLTTTGYGDVVPLHPFIRSLANLEAVIGQLFPATLLARLVSLHASTSASACDVGSAAAPGEGCARS